MRLSSWMFITVCCFVYVNGSAQTGISQKGTDSLMFFNQGQKTMVLSPNNRVRIGGSDFTSTSTILELNSTDKGILLPRLTTVERDAIADKVEGMLIYNVNANQFEVYDGTSDWNELFTPANIPAGDNLGSHTATTNVQLNGNYLSGDGGSEGLFVNNIGQVAIGTSVPNNLLHLGVSGGIQLTNSEIANVNATDGTIFYDANFFNSGEAGGGYFNGDGGGLAVYTGSDGWGALISTVNMQFLNMNLNSLNVTNNTTLLGNLTATGAISTYSDLLIESGGGAELNLRNGSGGSQWQVVSGFSGGFEIGYVTGGLTDGSCVLFANTSGNVGVGTTSVNNGKLEINGVGPSVSLSNFGYLISSGNTGHLPGPLSKGYSVYASGPIAAQEFNAHSDERIKNIIGISNGYEDLKTLNKIQITDYTMKDTLALGTVLHKKVIAQQVKEVYPHAVHSNAVEVVPDIYERATISNGWVALETDLRIGEKVKLIFWDKQEIFNVMAVNQTGFKVNTDYEGELFVYGRQVRNFHTIDYQAISMLNVSATQELNRTIEQLKKQNSMQSEEIEILKNKISELTNSVYRLLLLGELQGTD